MKHTLVVDVGNTHVDCGIFREDELLFTTLIKTDRVVAPKDYEQQFDAQLRSHNIALNTIEKAILGSVVPEITPSICRALHNLTRHTPLIANTDLRLNVGIRSINKKEVGIDLVANAVAARSRNPHHSSIIIDVGTVTSITAINRQAALCGVAIAPGLEMALSGITNRAALISPTDLVIPDHYLGTNTSEAIGVGVGLGLCGLINSIVEGMRRELSDRSMLFLSGGGAELIYSTLKDIGHYLPALTLEGYFIMLKLNS